NRMGFLDLAVTVLQDVGAIAMQYTYRATCQGGRVLAAIEPFARSFDTDETDIGMVDIRVENTDGVGASAHCGDDEIWLPPGGFRHLFEAFLADDALEVAHHHGVRMRTGGCTNDIE